MSEPEKKNLAANNDEASFLSRRQFFVKLGAGSLAIAGAGATVFAVQYLSPNVLYEPSPIVGVGRPEHFPIDSVTLDPRAAVFVVHARKGFYAMSSVCTHLGCLTVWKQDEGLIACPCHGSTFRPDGKVMGGPAPRPLQWLKMWIGNDGDLMVDRSANIASESEYVQL